MAHVLFVEDEENLRVAVGYTLRKDGHTVSVATSGPEAISSFIAKPFRMRELQARVSAALRRASLGTLARRRTSRRLPRAWRPAA